jgi:hypothetical protein
MTVHFLGKIKSHKIIEKAITQGEEDKKVMLHINHGSCINKSAC